jgi:hypothetical protein
MAAAAAAAAAVSLVVGTPTQVAGAVGYLVAKEMSGQAFSFTLARISDVLSRLSRHDSDAGKGIHAQLARLIPSAKLNITQALMTDFENLRTTSKTIDALLQAVDDAASRIMAESHSIELKIEAHNKEAWFAGWRSLDVSQHLDCVRFSVDALESNFALLAQLLPSCVVAMAAASHPPHQTPQAKTLRQSVTLTLMPPAIPPK